MRTLMVAAAAVLMSMPLAGPALAEPVAAPLCTEFSGTPAPEQMCEVHEATPQYMLDMVFPVDYPDSGALAGYLSQTRDGFLNVAEMPGNWNLPYALDVKTTRYSSGPPDTGTRSLVLEVYQNVGGAHPSTWYQTFNYDEATSSSLTFDSLFAPGSRPTEAIYPIVMDALTQQLGEPSITPVGDGLDPTHYQNFVITDDAVVFFFGQGELLPEAAGAVQASVPRNAIPPLAL